MSEAKKNPFEKAPLADESEEEKTEATGEVQSSSADSDSTKKEEPVSKAAEKKEPVKKADTPKPKKLTPTQERDQLRERVEQLEARLETKADVSDVDVVTDITLQEAGEGAGGETRLVGDGKTVSNESWRLTKDGLRVLVGRSSMQATRHFQIPVRLVPALRELLEYFEENIGGEKSDG